MPTHMDLAFLSYPRLTSPVMLVISHNPVLLVS